MVKLSQLTPLKKVKHLSRISVAFADIETFGTKSDVFRCGSIGYLRQKKPFIKTFWSFEDLFNYCRSFDVIYFYNVRFDSGYFRNYAFKNNVRESLIESGEKLLGVSFYELIQNTKKEAKIFTLKDMYQFSGSPPCSLKECAPSYGITLPKIDVDFDACSDKEIQAHCERDVLLLLLFAYKCREIFWENEGIDIFHKKIYSVPAVAIKVFRTNFLTNPIENPFAKLCYRENGRGFNKINTKLFDFAKNAYKGGFCNAFNTDLRENELQYDISSAYPFAITAIRFPVGRPFFTKDFNLWLKKVKKIPSIAQIKAYIPPNCGICGIREGKLVEIEGIHTETLTSYEILHILKKGGKILDFEGIYFTEYDKHNCAMKYTLHFYKLKEVDKGGKRSCDKLCLNSPYGKWGQSIYQTKRNYRFFKSEESFNEFLFESKYPIKTEQFDCGILAMWETQSISFKPFQNVIWASLVTAFVRIYLLENAYSVNADYSDTDSLKFQRDNLLKMQNVGEGLGYFDSEGEFEIFRAIAPKVYAGRYCRNTIIKGEDKSGEIYVRMKGVPNRFKHKVFYEILMNEGEIETPEYYRIMGASESLHAKEYFQKSDILGGIRLTKKTLLPKPKEKYIGEIENE